MSTQEEINFRKEQIASYQKNISMYNEILSSVDPNDTKTLDWARVSLETETTEMNKSIAILNVLEKNIV